jgi:hypothetical protein
MVLVAPRPVRTSAPPDRAGGAEVLALIRGDTAARPRFEPGLSGGLRAWLEDAAYEVVAARGEHAPPLLLGARRLLGSAAAPDDHVHSDDDGLSEGHRLSEGRILSRVVHVLFRQLVNGGEVADPLVEALEALGAAGPDPVVDRIEALSAPALAALSETVAAHAAHLKDMVPRFAPGWMPRTGDRVAIPLAGGRVVLHGVFDLLVGLPQPGTASLCALGLSTSGPWAHERRSLHYLALLETLRSGTPPFRLALLESATGRYGVEDVREEHLRAIASHLTAWLAGSTGCRV